jgi:hypothetical protein
MTYRVAAAKEPVPVETLLTLPVSTARGRDSVGCLGAIGVLFGCGVVALFMDLDDAPPNVARWMWTLAAGMVLFFALALYVHSRRRRVLRITRQGEERRLGVGGTVLTFPLRLRGTQVTVHVNGVPLHHVHLQCIDASGRAVYLHETRGAIHGKAADWFDDGLEKDRPGPQFDVAGAGTLADLRQRIERINDTVLREREKS